MDADTVARVWEARNQYARWQAALDDGVADVSSPNGEGFSPCEVHEEIAERLLDALLADVARELGDACDEATQIVLRHEFSSAANSIDASSVGGDDDDSDVLVVAGGETTTPPRIRESARRVRWRDAGGDGRHARRGDGAGGTVAGGGERGDRGGGGSGVH